MESNLDKALKHLSEQIKKYRETDVLDGLALNQILQQVTPTIYYLEKERAKAHERYHNLMHEYIKEGEQLKEKRSMASAENYAEVNCHEMYLLRRILDASYECTQSIRSNIFYSSQERRLSETQA